MTLLTRWLSGALLLGLCSGASAQADQQRFSVDARQDNTLRRTSEINMGQMSQLHLGFNGGVGDFRPIIQFDDWLLPQNGRLERVTLDLFYEQVAYGDGAREVCVHRVLSPWAEGNATHFWDNVQGNTGSSWLRRTADTLWNTAGGDHEAMPTDCIQLDAAQIGERISFDVSSTVQEAEYGYIVIAQAQDYRKDRFASLQSEVPELRPTLTVTYELLLDVDGDGFTSDVDCNDNDADVNPGASEILDDGVDNDCNPATADMSPGRRTLTVQTAIDNTIRAESEVNMGLDSMLYISFDNRGGYRPLVQFESWS
ncbi:MAG: DNRLRE domain-containing protein, partial [Bradymonadia bacterium]